MSIEHNLIKKLPKTDLHVHMDGSLRIQTLIDLAKEYRIKLPSYTVEGMKETVFKSRYKDLGEYLHPFKYLVSVLQSGVALQRAACELVEDNIAEGVRYIEVRFAPQLHMHEHLNAESVLLSVNRGLQEARDEFNRRPEVMSGQEPPFNYGIIVCAMRMFDTNFSEYFANLIKVHNFSSRRRIFSLASYELAQAAVHIRDEYGIPIVGFDLAGQEAGYPAVDHREAYSYAHRNFLKKTVHAGEAYGPESIFQAITELHADRIGHGYYLLDTTMIQEPTIEDREAYVHKLSHYIADRRITLEICLTSNLQTNPNLTDFNNHAAVKMQEERLSMTFCTDNRTVSDTTVTKELEIAVQALKLGPRELRDIIIYGFKRSFYPGTYIEKRQYVRQIIDYYLQLEGGYRQGEESDLKKLNSKKMQESLALAEEEK